MKKLLYISFWDFSLKNGGGVSKKILCQSKAFEKAGYDTTILGRRGSNVIELKGSEEKSVGEIHSALKKRFGFFKLVKLYVKQHEFNAVYIRYPLCDRLFAGLLKEIKRKNKAKIVVEIPTYPYNAECVCAASKMLLMLDKMNRHKLKKYVNRIASFSNDKSIFGIKTIQISNGIDFSETEIKTHFDKKENELNVDAVAGMYFWHGYDRFIMGLADYYKENPELKVILHLAGDGPEIRKYKELVEKNNLSDYVVFHGYKTENELDEIYENADLAIDCLGAHRKNLARSSSLKSREYCAKGLPIITSCEIDALPSKKSDFILKLPADESNINIKDVVSFYDDLIKKYTNSENLARNIRRVSKARCDFTVTAKPVIDFFEK
jgi:glycosyltransferase involved in cell wall biosynthesis